MRRYFKLVALYAGREQWLIDEFHKGRVHFGWGLLGTDLRVVRDIPRAERTEDQRSAWRHANFFLEKLEPGDRLVIQLAQPLREFLLAEVTGEYCFTEPPEPDFNHYRECRPLTPSPVAVNNVSFSLRHDLTKRGQYYQIYSPRSTQELDLAVEEELWRLPAGHPRSPIEDELEATRVEVVANTLAAISERWPAKDFETFVVRLVNSLPGVRVKKEGDNHKGWDLTLRITDPVTGEVLLDDIPAQCKNYKGTVKTLRPFEDLRRCIENSTAGCAYLFTLGDLDHGLQERIGLLQEELSREQGREIRLHVVGPERIAELYLRYMGRQLGIETEGDTER